MIPEEFIVTAEPTIAEAKVETPDTFNVVALANPRKEFSVTEISLAVNESNIKSPTIFKLPPTERLLKNVPIPIKVETPDTFTLSSSVCPSTSKDPLASIAPVKVEAPDTFTSSSSVCPSTSKDPLASIAPVKVETPDTFKLSSSV